MSVGPVLLFDKSTLQSLSPDEAVWLDTFYRANITPLFFVETLADLGKQVARGRTPEQVVGSLAYKTPCRGGLPNVHHLTLCRAELLGRNVRPRGVPIVGGGQAVVTGDRRGVLFRRLPEMEAFERWQRGEFLTVDRLFARFWRRALSGLDLESIYQQFRPTEGGRLRDFSTAKAVAVETLNHDGARYEMLKMAMAAVEVPELARSEVIARWKAAGGPHLREFAPYTAHVLTVDRFFNLALGSDLISRDRPSNKIDIAYLYYLPFCMVFVSNDWLHAACAACFLGRDQTFVPGEELKRDLAKLDGYYSALPKEVRSRGVMVFAKHPPPEGDYLTVLVWDRFLPRWRELLSREEPRSRAQDEATLELLRQFDHAEPAAEQNPGAESDFVQIERHVPLTMGKWRLLPEEIEQGESNEASDGQRRD